MQNLTTRRILSIGVAILLLFLGAWGMGFLSESKEAPPRKEGKAIRLKTVETQAVRYENLASQLAIQGQLAAFDKIELYAEVGGSISATGRAFKVGTYFPKGSPLLKIDASEVRLGLLAQKSTLLNAITQAMPDLKIDYPTSFSAWEAYLNSFDVEQALVALPEPQTDQEKRFIAARNLYTQYYNIKSQEERLKKYTLYAPFGGVLTSTQVRPGTVIRAGQLLGNFMATGNYELVATVPLSDLSEIKIGNKVSLRSDDVSGEWTGTVRRISDQIDASSQTVQVFVSVQGKGLREGMYLHGAVSSRAIDNAFRINRELLINSNQVYIVKDSLLQLMPVELVRMEPQHAIIRGLPVGTTILQAAIPGAFDGMKVSPQGTAASLSTNQ